MIRLRRPLAWANRDQEEIAKADLLGILLEWIFSLISIDLRKAKIFKLPTKRSELVEEQEAFALRPASGSVEDKGHPVPAEASTHYHSIGGPLLYATFSDTLNRTDRQSKHLQAFVPLWGGIEEIEEIELESVQVSPTAQTPTVSRPKIEDMAPTEVDIDQEESVIEEGAKGSSLFAKPSSARGQAIGEGQEDFERPSKTATNGWTKDVSDDAKDVKKGEADVGEAEEELMGREVTRELLKDGLLIVSPIEKLANADIPEGREGRLLGEEANQRLGGLFADYRCDDSLTISFFLSMMASTTIIGILFGVQAGAKILPTSPAAKALNILAVITKGLYFLYLVVIRPQVMVTLFIVEVLSAALELCTLACIVGLQWNPYQPSLMNAMTGIQLCVLCVKIGSLWMGCLNSLYGWIRRRYLKKISMEEKIALTEK